MKTTPNNGMQRTAMRAAAYALILLPPNHALQRTGTASLRVAVNRPLSLLSLGGIDGT